MSQLDDFVAAHDGQFLNFYPGDTDQCVDLADAWSALFLATLPPMVIIIAVAAYLLLWGSNVERAAFVAWALLP